MRFMSANEQPVLLHLYTRFSSISDYKNNAFPGGAQLCCFRLANHFNQKGFKVIVGSDDPEDSKAVSEIRKAGILHYKLPFSNYDTRSTFKCFRDLFQLVRNTRPLIIHSHHRRTTIFANFIASLRKSHLIYNAHNAFFDKKYFGRFAGNNVIAVSQGTKKNLVNYFGISPDNITVIYNGAIIDEPSRTEVDECRARLELNGSERVASFIGRIAER